MHLDFIDTITLTGLTAPTFDIKTKTSSFIAANFSLRLGGKKLTDGSEDTSIGGWV